MFCKKRENLKHLNNLFFNFYYILYGEFNFALSLLVIKKVRIVQVVSPLVPTRYRNMENRFNLSPAAGYICGNKTKNNIFYNKEYKEYDKTGIN